MNDTEKRLSVVRSIAKNVEEIYGPTAELLAVYAKILGIRHEEISFLSKDHIESTEASCEITVLVHGKPICIGFGPKTYDALKEVHTIIACLVVKTIEDKLYLEDMQKKAISSYAVVQNVPDESVQISIRMPDGEWVCTLSSLHECSAPMTARNKTQREALQDILTTLRFDLSKEQERLTSRLARINLIIKE